MKRVLLTFSTDSDISDTLHRIADQEENIDILILTDCFANVEIDNSLEYNIAYESYYIDTLGRERREDDNEWLSRKFNEKPNHLGLTPQQADDIKAFIDSITYDYDEPKHEINKEIGEILGINTDH